MDPNETLRLLANAATSKATSPQHAKGNAEAIRAHAEALATWLERGGFAPEDPREAHYVPTAEPVTETCAECGQVFYPESAPCRHPWGSL